MVLKEFGCELDYEGKDFRKKVSDVWWKIIREEKSELAALANNTIALGFKVMKEVTIWNNTLKTTHNSPIYDECQISKQRF